MKQDVNACSCEEASEEELSQRLGDVLAEYGNTPGALIPVLQTAQGIYGYLPDHVIRRIASELGITYSRAAGVVGFYSFFSTVPRGRHLIRVCLGTACYVRGGKQVLDQVRKLTGVDVGGTTADGMFSLEVARCFGACGLAPVMTIGDDVHQRVKPAVVGRILDRYRREVPRSRNAGADRLREAPSPAPGAAAGRIGSVHEYEEAAAEMRAADETGSGWDGIDITVHMGTCGIAAGARDVLGEMLNEIEKNGIENVVLHHSGCRGLCAHEPMATVTDGQGRVFCYGNLNKGKVRRIMKDHILHGMPVVECMVKS